MARRCFPITSPRYFKIITKLAAPFLAILTILFLVLPGVTGPQTGIYWLRVEYGSQGADQHQGLGMIGQRDINSSGEIWELGCLGSCKVGENCQQGQEFPPHSNPIQDVLRFHLFVTAAFFVISWSSFILFKFPQANITKRYGTALPTLGPILTSILMITDICIAHTLEGKRDVNKVDRVGVFWLGTVAFVLSILWFIFAQLDGMYRRHEDGEFDEPIRDKEGEAEQGVMERGVAGIGSLWPWKGQTKERREEDRGRIGAGVEKDQVGRVEVVDIRDRNPNPSQNQNRGLAKRGKDRDFRFV